MIVRHRSLLRLPMPHLAEERHRIGISLDIELSGGVLSRAMQACSEFAVGHAVWPDRSFRCELERANNNLDLLTISRWLAFEQP
jgi:hypothetical protein